MPDQIWREYRRLPVEARRQVAEFITVLRRRHEMTPPERLPALRDEPFFGMWRDRDEMQDSSAWVRSTRRKEWGEPVD